MLFFFLSALGRVVLALCSPQSSDFITQYVACSICVWDIFVFLWDCSPWSFNLVGESVYRGMRKEDKVLLPLLIF